MRLVLLFLFVYWHRPSKFYFLDINISQNNELFSSQVCSHLHLLCLKCGTRDWLFSRKVNVNNEGEMGLIHNIKSRIQIMASKNKYVKSMIKGDVYLKNDFFMLTYQTPGNCDSIVNNTISSNLKYTTLCSFNLFRLR